MTNHIRRNILMSFVLWTFACLAYAAPKSEAAKVRSIIDKVNNSWQTRHKLEATPFWYVASTRFGCRSTMSPSSDISRSSHS